MSFLAARMKAFLLVSGALTTSMIYAAFEPAAALRATFGEALQGAAAELVVRNWGVLVALVGAMLVHAAFVPSARPLAMSVAGASKLAFVALVLSHGTAYLGSAGIAVAADLVMAGIFAAYLLRGASGAQPGLRFTQET